MPLTADPTKHVRGNFFLFGIGKLKKGISLAKARSELLDAVAESDDTLLEKYLAEGDLTNEELLSALPKAVANGA